MIIGDAKNQTRHGNDQRLLVFNARIDNQVLLAPGVLAGRQGKAVCHRHAAAASTALRRAFPLRRLAIRRAEVLHQRVEVRLPPVIRVDEAKVERLAALIVLAGRQGKAVCHRHAAAASTALRRAFPLRRLAAAKNQTRHGNDQRLLVFNARIDNQVLLALTGNLERSTALRRAFPLRRLAAAQGFR
jgi:ABC-type transporter Mla MlaB component